MDKSARNLHQQQGLWATHPDRELHAFKFSRNGGVLSANALMSIGASITQSNSSLHFHESHMPDFVGCDASSMLSIITGFTPARLWALLPYLDPNDYTNWSSNMTMLKAVAPVVGHDIALQAALDYSAMGSTKAKARNIQGQYDPAVFFKRVTPTVQAEIAVAALCSHARDQATSEVKHGNQEAAVYLATWHPTYFEHLCQELGI